MGFWNLRNYVGAAIWKKKREPLRVGWGKIWPMRVGRFDNYCEGYGKIMIIPPKALFCLNAKTTLKKWKATAKKKEFSLTYLQLVGVVKEKREMKKVQHFRSLSTTVYTKLVFFCESSKKSIKGKFFFFKIPKKNVSLWK